MKAPWHLPKPAEAASIDTDVVVVGAGFGGLATALTLAERGLWVVVLETVGYPGGCASAFEWRGYRFEAGATLFSGFAEGQFLHRWIDRHDLAVTVDVPEPVVELRSSELRLAITARRRELVINAARLRGRAPWRRRLGGSRSAAPWRAAFDETSRGGDSTQVAGDSGDAAETIPVIGGIIGSALTTGAGGERTWI